MLDFGFVTKVDLMQWVIPNLSIKLMENHLNLELITLDMDGEILDWAEWLYRVSIHHL